MAYREIHVTSLSKTTHKFTAMHNNGGRRGIDCGLISIKQAAKEAGIDRYYFQAPIDEIRRRMAGLVHELPPIEVNALATTYIPRFSTDDPSKPPTKNDLKRICDAILTETLPFELIRCYERKYHPNEVNLISCMHTGNANQFICTAPPYKVNPDLPILFIGHWPRRCHYEAFIPERPSSVAQDLSEIDGWRHAIVHDVRLDAVAIKEVKIFTVDNGDNTMLLHTKELGYHRFSNRSMLISALHATHASGMEQHRFDPEQTAALPIEMETSCELLSAVQDQLFCMRIFGMSMCD